MELTFSQNLIGLEDGPLLDDEGKITTLRAISIRAVVGMYQDEQNLSGEEKVSRWELALKIKKADPITLTVEELALTRKLIAKMFGPLVVGQAWKMLEGIK